MKIILEGLINNLLIEECVQKATLTEYPHSNHTPTMIQENIAHFVNKFVPEMATPPIRIRTRSRRVTIPATSARNTRKNPCEILEE